MLMISNANLLHVSMAVWKRPSPVQGSCGSLCWHIVR